MSFSQPGRAGPEAVAKIFTIELKSFVEPTSLPPYSGGVYAFYDAHGTLLYIGQTGSFTVRFSDHRRTKKWFSDVARIVAYPLADCDLRLCLETALILKHRPKYNRAVKLNVSAGKPLQEMQFLRFKPRR